MRPPTLNLFAWLTGYSGWAFYCALLSVFGLTGYYADLLRGYVPDWVGVGLLIAPLIIIVFIQWGEAPDRFVAISHLIAALWFMTLALEMEIGHVFRHDPTGSVFYRILAHLGWTFAWAGIYRRARLSRQRTVEQDRAANGSQPVRPE
jgi:hypothetical protein